MSAMTNTERLDGGKSAEQLLAERGKRVEDALQLKQPDRIPLQMPSGYFLADYGGVTHREQQDNWEKAQELLEKVALDFQPDAILGLFNNPRPSLVLGDRMTKWPGYGLPDTGSFQFDEHEFMKGEDYDAFDRTIDSHIKNLRRKLGDDEDPQAHIQTVYGVGYRLRGDD